MRKVTTVPSSSVQLRLLNNVLQIFKARGVNTLPVKTIILNLMKMAEWSRFNSGRGVSAPLLCKIFERWEIPVFKHPWCGEQRTCVRCASVETAVRP